MTYQEYEKKFSEVFRKLSKENSKDSTEKFLSLILDGNHCKKQFLDDCKVAELTGDKSRVNPVAFASWAVDLYPDDFKTSVKVDEKNTVFSGTMDFQSIR